MKPLHLAAAALFSVVVAAAGAAADVPREPPPAKLRDGEIRAIVRRVLGAAQDPARCSAVTTGAVVQIECKRTECNSCNVTHVITRLVQRYGKWQVGGTRRERRGDTGECGCCQLSELTALWKCSPMRSMTSCGTPAGTTTALKTPAG